MSNTQTGHKNKDFWNIRSKSFPGHREGDTYQARMLDIAREHGVDFSGHVLDLGCGTGAYTIRLAREAEKVTALDISEGMLDTVKREAQANGLNNITTVNADWAVYQPVDKYDVIFCSLTPAVSDADAVEKIGNYASKWVINIGFAGPMKANVMDALFKQFGTDDQNKKNDSQQDDKPKMRPVMKNWLDSRNIQYALYRVQGDWVTHRTEDEMLDNCLDILEAHGIEPDMTKLKEFIAPFYDPELDKYTSITAYDVEMLIWKK